MMPITHITLLSIALCGTFVLGAQDTGSKPASSPELSALRKQNEILEERIKQMVQQRQVEKLGDPDPVTVQSQALEQRLKLLGLQQSLLQYPVSQRAVNDPEAPLDRKEETSIESARLAYKALSGVALDVAKDLSCAGKNIVLYGPSYSEALLLGRAFEDQVELLHERLKSVLEIPAPAPPDQPASTGSSVFGAGALTGAVLQSTLDLVALFHSGARSASAGPAVDESALIAVIAEAATAQGCLVYWPDHYSSNPLNPGSRVMALLQSLAEVNDNGGAAGKPAGLQQRIRALKGELRRSDDMIETLSQKIEEEEAKLTDASQRADALKTHVDWLTGHIQSEKDLSLQSKLNTTFAKTWDDLETAVKRQLASAPPGTIEEQNKMSDMSRRLDLLKTQTGWLAQFVKDEKDLVLQERIKQTLAATWTELDAAVKSQRALASSVPKNTEPDRKEQRRWGKYSSDLKELIATETAASEAYTTFRGALLDAGSGTSPLSRVLRAEALRDLMFDEKSQERTGASIVQLNLQRLTGSIHVSARTSADPKETYSGGVVLSFVQYEPNGKVRHSGVHTGYLGFQNQP